MQTIRNIYMDKSFIEKINLRFIIIEFFLNYY